MLTPEEIKEANRLYWIVKGQLIPDTWDEASVQSILKDYARRIWHNHEATSVHESGFEEAWAARHRLPS
jgi:hypothetical protein